MQSLNVHQAPATNKVTPPNPKKVKLSFDYNGSPDGVDHNLLVLLHGLGNDFFIIIIFILVLKNFISIR